MIAGAHKQASNTNAAKLYYALVHHASKLEGIISVIAIGFMVELYPLGWKIRPVKGAANSYMLYKGKKEYHFRAGMQPGSHSFDRIDVKDSYFNGNVVFQMDTRNDAFKFIQDRVKES